MTELDKILSKLDDAPGSFVSKLPDIEKQIFSEIVAAVKDLKIDSSGKVVANIENLKVVNSIKVKLAKLILSSNYKSAVKELVQEFQSISDLSDQYWGFAPLVNCAMFKAVKDIAIDNTLERLAGTGYTSTVVSTLGDMLVKVVTGGGMYNDLVEGLRSELLTTDKSTGLLSRYAQTYVTDAVSQFSGQQMKLLSLGLNSQRFQYVGGNIDTTREFCEHLTKKEYIHVSELSEILRGHIDGHVCKLYDKTGLPMGMIEGTNTDNLIINRGGHNCRHRLVPVNEVAVPKILRDKFVK